MKSRCLPACLPEMKHGQSKLLERGNVEDLDKRNELSRKRSGGDERVKIVDDSEGKNVHFDGLRPHLEKKDC